MAFDQGISLTGAEIILSHLQDLFFRRPCVLLRHMIKGWQGQMPSVGDCCWREELARDSR